MRREEEIGKSLEGEIISPSNTPIILSGPRRMQASSPGRSVYVLLQSEFCSTLDFSRNNSLRHIN